MPPISPRKIDSYRKKVANVSRGMALKIIANIHPSETVPILLKILSDGLPKIQDTAENKATLEFGRFAKQMLKQVDELQQAAFYKVPGILSAMKETIHANLNELKDRAKDVRVEADTKDLWVEAEIWLEGWYQHSYQLAQRANCLTKDANGKYLRYDKEDKLFFWKVGMTKLEAAEYYQVVAAEIKRQLDQLGIDNAEQPRAPQEQQAQAAEPGADIIEIEAAGKGTRFIVNLPTKDKATLKRLRDAVMLSLNPEQEVLSIISGKALTDYGSRPDDNGMADMLASVANDPDEVRFAVLEYGITTGGLTEKQAEKLGKIKEVALAKLDGYINKPYRLPGTGISLFPSYFERCNVDIARNAVIELDDASRVEDQLKVMFELRNTLLTRNSTRLLSQVDDILNTTFTILQKVPYKDMVLASAAGRRV